MGQKGLKMEANMRAYLKFVTVLGIAFLNFAIYLLMTVLITDRHEFPWNFVPAIIGGLTTYATLRFAFEHLKTSTKTGLEEKPVRNFVRTQKWSLRQKRITTLVTSGTRTRKKKK